MTAPVSYQVLNTLKTRLQAITVVGGYNTDAGAGVFLGKRRVNQDQLDTGPVINIYDVDDEPDEEVAYGDEPIRSTMTIHVDALILDASETGVLLAHEVMQDIFNATLTDQTVGGLALRLWLCREHY